MAEKKFDLLVDLINHCVNDYVKKNLKMPMDVETMGSLWQDSGDLYPDIVDIVREIVPNYRIKASKECIEMLKKHDYFKKHPELLSSLGKVTVNPDGSYSFSEDRE